MAVVDDSDGRCRVADAAAAAHVPANARRGDGGARGCPALFAVLSGT
jgi:hypothetical protein